MKVDAIQCVHCGDTVFSRTHHDMRFCSCGKVSIDGGRDYCRVGFRDINDFEMLELEINLTTKQLYDDWNRKEDKYGRF